MNGATFVAYVMTADVLKMPKMLLKVGVWLERRSKGYRGSKPPCFALQGERAGRFLSVRVWGF